MYKIALDTSIYIPMLRSGKMPGSVLESGGAIVCLSVVVMQELYAGAVDVRTGKALDEFYDVFLKNNRLIVPTVNNWRECGVILSQIGRKYGFESIKKGRIVNDVLIALSCGEADTVVLTANHKDFSLIHKFVKFQFLGI